MKKQGITILILFIVILVLNSSCYASQEEILQSQSETLNIKGFVSQANEYTKDVFDGMDAGTLLNDAIQGKIDNKTIFQKILSLFGNEVKDTLRIIRKYYCNYCYS